MNARDAYLRRLGQRANTHLRRQHEGERMPEPYSEATVELVAAATEQHFITAGQTDAMGNSQCTCGQWWDAAGDNPGWDQHMAEVTLKALTEAGLLLPEGADLRTEWAVWWLGPGDGIRLSKEHLTSQTKAEQVAATRVGEYGIVRWELRRREHRLFADGSCWSGPWSAVPPEPKEGAGGQPSPA